MRDDLKSGKSLRSYFEEKYPCKDEDLLFSTIEVLGDAPVLKIPTKKEFNETECENAIALHKYYKSIDETQASDSRLWTYLSHVEFRDYVMKRWNSYSSEKALGDNKDKAITYLLDHYFIRDNDRGLRHHAVARLWWAAQLTYAPWEGDPDFFGDLKKDDPYYFTRVLLSDEDIYQTFLERGLGRSNRVLISVLEYLDEDKEFSGLSGRIHRSLAKELNLIYGVKKLASLDRKGLKSLIQKIGSEIKAFPLADE